MWGGGGGMLHCAVSGLFGLRLYAGGSGGLCRGQRHVGLGQHCWRGVPVGHPCRGPGASPTGPARGGLREDARGGLLCAIRGLFESLNLRAEMHAVLAH